MHTTDTPTSPSAPPVSPVMPTMPVPDDAATAVAAAIPTVDVAISNGAVAIPASTAVIAPPVAAADTSMVLPVTATTPAAGTAAHKAWEAADRLCEVLEDILAYVSSPILAQLS